MSSLPPRSDRPHVVKLWDASWYTRTGPVEPFEDLDRALPEAREFGYDTVRICAMPFLLFRFGADTSALGLGPPGGEYGQCMWWHDVRHATMIDARAHLLELFPENHTFTGRELSAGGLAVEWAWRDCDVAIRDRV